MSNPSEDHVQKENEYFALTWLSSRHHEGRAKSPTRTHSDNPLRLHDMTDVSPSEHDLTQALISLRAENPTLGVSKLHALLLSAHPTWTVSEKRTRKVLQNEGLILGPAPSASAKSPSPGEPLPTSRVIEGLDVAKWTSKVEVRYFGKSKGKGLVAKEKIAEGEVIWKEDPFILAPEWYVSLAMLDRFRIDVLPVFAPGCLSSLQDIGDPEMRTRGRTPCSRRHPRSPPVRCSASQRRTWHSHRLHTGTSTLCRSPPSRARTAARPSSTPPSSCPAPRRPPPPHAPPASAAASASRAPRGRTRCCAPRRTPRPRRCSPSRARRGGWRCTPSRSAPRASSSRTSRTKQRSTPTGTSCARSRSSAWRSVPRANGERRSGNMYADYR